MTAPSEFLSPDELRDLTGFAQPAKQGPWLRDQGIPNRVDGRRIIVSRYHAREWLAGREIVAPVEPDFSHFDAQAH